MTRHRFTTAICMIITVLMLAVTILFMFSDRLGMTAVAAELPYVTKLFSTDRVHTIDIVVDEDDWQTILDNAAKKEYISCTVVIDGEAYKNVAIRTKGNSSLSSIASGDSDRYSFKVEFDHYVSGKTYYGLDKLALNNITQDNTYLKDYVSYQMMNKMGADAPLSSFAYITVNGQDWGLYLAVEGIEESFAQRVYGNDYGQIYKPDSMSMNGDRNNDDRITNIQMPEGFDGQMPEGFDGQMPEGFTGQMPEGFDGQMPEGFTGQMPGGDGAATPENEDGQPSESSQNSDGQAEASQSAQDDRRNRTNAGGGLMVGMGGMGGGSNDVALQYSDDAFDSYSNIFDSAKFPITDADKERLIASIKQLNAGENLEEVVDIDEVLRYFVVHNFTLNFDSYTGSMMHNYYLYEKDGVMRMIAWDYNLAFGGFSMGGSGTSAATSMANYPIDTPTSGVALEDRPMLGQLLNNETYLEQYHALFAEFMETCFDSGWFSDLVDDAIALISPYVEKDPTSFCTYEDYVSASATLKEFCLLRAQSIQGQLDGAIPATNDGQSADSSALIDASGIDMSSMNSSSFGMGRMNNNFRTQQGNGMQDGVTGPLDPQSDSSENSASDAGIVSVTDSTSVAVATSTESIEPPPQTLSPAAATVTSETGQPDAESTPPPSSIQTDSASPAAESGAEAPPSTGNSAPGGFGASEQSGTQASNTWPNGNAADTRAFMGSIENAAASSSTSWGDTQTYVLLGASALVLIAGLVFAGVFKKH